MVLSTNKDLDKTGKHFHVLFLFFCSFIFSNHHLADQIIFTEIMYHPQDAEQPAWVEISNLTSTPLDCARWELKGKDIEYIFPEFDRQNPSDSFIKPFEQCILTEADPISFRDHHGIDSGIRIFGPWQGKLNHKKEHLILTDKNGITLSEIEFNNDPPWPIEAAGAGYSMVIRHPDRTVNNWRNWKASQYPGGTPGVIPFPDNGVLFQIPTNKEAFVSFKILPMDASWRFHPGVPDLNAGWASVSFDDSKWASGKALLGFEDVRLPSPGLQTVVSKGPMTYCFRTNFEINHLESVTHLELNQIVDDGVLYYLNGIPIGSVRFSSQGGGNRFETPAAESVTNAGLETSVIKLDPTHLVEGTNVLAAEVHQINPDSTDLVFGAELIAFQPKINVPIQLTEVGISTDGAGYALIKNRANTSLNLNNYWIVASNPGDESPRVIATPEDQVVESGATHKILFDHNIQPSALVACTRKQDAVHTPLPLALPGKGYKQRLIDSAQGIWKVDRISSPSQNGQAAVKKGQVVINEISRPSSNVLDIELYNPSSQVIHLQRLALSLDQGFQNTLTLNGTLDPKAFSSFQITVEDLDDQTFRVFLFHQATFEVIDAQRKRVPPTASIQRFPDGGEEWFKSDANTLAAPNKVHRIDDVVINEILYDPPFGQPNLEFIELFNRGSNEIDLSGWQFDEGVSYTFPEGTLIASGEFLVIADKPETLNQAHAGLSALGPLGGKLGNDGERIRLLDAQGNLADEIDYRAEGDWPSLAHGKGSSMELQHPSLNNAHSSAWKDSRVSRSSEFRKYAFTNRYFGHREIWNPMDFRELHLYLVGESHVILQNIRLQEKGTTENLLRHPDRLSIEGDGSTGWLIQGNHSDSYIENGRLHLISHGHGDNRANRAEIDITNLKQGTEYELSFEARWVHGSPRLIARTWENSISESILLPIPAELGTPGERNSRWLPNPPALIESLQQFPAVPAPGESLSIQVDIGWPQEPGLVNLVYRRDGDREESWTRVPMSPKTNQPVSSDALTTYDIDWDNAFRQGELIQYYVEAIPSKGIRTTLPRGAAAAPALCVFDGRPIPSDLRVVRLLISADHLNAIYRGESQEYGFHYPRLSNQYFNATFISNERDIYTDAVLRSSGSPWTRQNSMDRGKWKLPNDRRFRDHGKFSFDNDPTRSGGRYRHHNRIARYLLYLLGHVSGENEFIYVIINAGSIQVREDVEPVDADYLNRNFKDGNKGELYRIDDDWWMSDHWSQSNLDASWNYFGTDHPALYRHSWMKRSKEEEDDYTAFIDFIKLINRPDYTQEDLESVLDADAMIKMTAVLGFIADWDTFTQSRGKNAYFYRRPSDHRFQLLQWDADLSFGTRRYSGFYGGSRQFKGWIEQPYNLPTLLNYLDQLVDWTNGQNSRVEAWMAEELKGNNGTHINRPFYRQFFTDRKRSVNQLKRQFSE